MFIVILLLLISLIKDIDISVYVYLCHNCLFQGASLGTVNVSLHSLRLVTSLQKGFDYMFFISHPS